jgi:virulence factor Mce-like protein
MRGLSLRLATNLVWLVAFTVVVSVGALLTYASGVFFDDSYPVSVPMPEAGGVLPLQEVTVLGRAVGQVTDVTLTQEGVLIELSIRGDAQVPEEAVVRVLRRSPIGEQAVDFTPVAADWTAAEPGSLIQPVEAIVPAEVPFLLQETVELFRAIDVEDVATIIEEAAIALEGRGPTLRQLGRSSLDLNRTLVAGIPEFERLIESSDTVLETLADQREELARTFTNGADLLEVLGEQRGNVEDLLDAGTPALLEAEAFIVDNRANVSCLVDDLQALTDMLTGPSTWDGTADPDRYDSKLAELEQLLVLHESFFQRGFAVLLQPDPTTGVDWARIQFTTDPAGGQVYPEKRPTPATLPGAACEDEVWGTGVNAVRQASPQPADPTSPGILYAPLVQASDGSGVTAPERTLADRGALPATGGGILAAAPLLVGAALWMRGRRR